MTISALLSGLDEELPSVRSRGEAASWRDPQTGFQRWSISPPSHGYDIELVWAELPSGQRIEYAAPAYTGMEQHIVLFEGALRFEAEGTSFELRRNDVLRIRLYGATALQSCGRSTAKYLIAIRSPR